MKKATLWLVLIVLLVAAGAWYVFSKKPSDMHPSIIDLPEVSPVTVQPVAAFPVEQIRPAAEPLPVPVSPSNNVEKSSIRSQR